MLRLRPYKRCDGEKIAAWLKDEKIFTFWGGDRFGSFPITGDIINEKYFANNGDCTEEDNFYPLTATDDGKTVGHFIIRYIGGDISTLRFGWVIVDDSIRGKGYGKRMLTLGLRYAFDILGGERVTIGVYEQNLPAYHCYKSVGFTESAVEGCSVGEERIIEMELKKDDFAKLHRS